MEVHVPDGVCGAWRVETFTVSEEEANRCCLRAIFRPHERIAPGTYKRLMRDRTVVMTNTPMEMLTNWPIIQNARGAVLINGLGLGMVLTAVLRKPEVQRVVVVEKSEEVLTLCGPTFEADPRVELVNADALTYVPKAGERFDAAWHDIWDYICGDNLPEMAKLHRRYGRRAAWQGSWARDLCKRA